MTDKKIKFLLKMIHEFKNREIPLDIFTIADKDFLTYENYIVLNEHGYFLTQKGIDKINSEDVSVIKIQYPLMVKGRVKTYNKVINTMSESAANALVCAMINEKFMNKITTSNTRVFIQSLLDNKNYHKWGEELINKMINTLNDSKKYFESKNV